MTSLQAQEAFDVLNHQTKMKLAEKVALLQEFTTTDLTVFSGSEGAKTLKNLQVALINHNSRSWNSGYCVGKLSKIYCAYKEHKDTSERTPCSEIFSFFIKMEDMLDEIMAESKSYMDAETSRNCSGQGKSSKPQPQDDVDWDESTLYIFCDICNVVYWLVYTR